MNKHLNAVLTKLHTPKAQRMLSLLYTGAAVGSAIVLVTQRPKVPQTLGE